MTKDQPNHNILKKLPQTSYSLVESALAYQILKNYTL